MVECPIAVRSGPQPPLGGRSGAAKKAERCLCVAVIAFLAVSLHNARAVARTDAARVAQLRRLLWQQQDKTRAYADAFQRARTYAGVLVERLARYEPAGASACSQEAFRRAERAATETD
jgi:hypothetical protein